MAKTVEDDQEGGDHVVGGRGMLRIIIKSYSLQLRGGHGDPQIKK